jgi:magnesium chelatase family protein
MAVFKLCPAENGSEAAWGGDIDILAANSLTELLNHLRGTQLLSPVNSGTQTPPPSGPDMADLRGQETARRAIEIAATGGHNLLMIGAPGAGKSMLAARLPDLLPPLSAREVLEVTVIHSIMGQAPKGGLCQKRPFREPHHSASMAALIGGRQKAMPGEISLAHNGVLFLDELAEFNRIAIDSLRQPTETGEIIIVRANNHIRYPTRFQLIAAMNPCRCGYLSDASRACSRAPDCARHYMSKVSGPMLDGFVIMIDVAELLPLELLSPSVAENSANIHSRIVAAREFGASRHNGEDSQVNARLSADQIERHIDLPLDIKRLLEEAMTKQKLSARGFHKVIRAAQTIADLERSENFQHHHILEALSYRAVLSGPLPG